MKTALTETDFNALSSCASRIAEALESSDASFIYDDASPFCEDFKSFIKRNEMQFYGEDAIREAIKELRRGGWLQEWPSKSKSSTWIGLSEQARVIVRTCGD